MAATEDVLALNSAVENVLKLNGARFNDLDLDTRNSEEASLTRYEAARWLRKTVGVVGGKDLPAQPSEEEFRLGLRSGILLCNVLNKIEPGAVPKVVEGPCDSVLVTDGAALLSSQYFGNVRNFIVALEKMGLPTFEASDLEKGGETARVVDCVMALMSYSDSKQGACAGSWRRGRNLRSASSEKQFTEKNLEAIMNYFSKILFTNGKHSDDLSDHQNSHGDDSSDAQDMSSSPSLAMLVRTFLMDNTQEEIQSAVESLLNKVISEFKCQMEKNSFLRRIPSQDTTELVINESIEKSGSSEIQVERGISTNMGVEECCSSECCTSGYNHEHDSITRFLKRRELFDRHNEDIQALKQTLQTTRRDFQFLQMKHEDELNYFGEYLQGLSNFASQHKQILEENRKLYNQVQDFKGSIRVYCRVRPFLSGKANCTDTVEHLEEGSITIFNPLKNGKEGKKLFNFNKVFGPSASQEEVYSDTQPLIRSVLDGYNVCIFAYGQTGSGKTYTMSGRGGEQTEGSYGVNYRALCDLFTLSEQRKYSVAYRVSVQMIEIYNDQVRDLLASDGVNKKLEIRKSSQNGTNVPDASIFQVSTTSDVISLMNLGHKNRAVSATALNDRSSRSHSCLTVKVEGRDTTSGSIVHGCMHLVDLAGSERVERTEVTGDRLKEATHINKSLSALGDVISSLAQKNPHVPYRNSKLTQLLQDSLGGQAKTLMFVHISPESGSLSETISTLKFAERVSSVELGSARINKENAEVKDLRDQVASLKAALARRDGEQEKQVGSGSSSPGGLITRSAGASPPHHSWKDLESSFTSARPANDKPKQQQQQQQRRQSLDMQELVRSSLEGNNRQQLPGTLFRRKVHPEHHFGSVAAKREGGTNRADTDSGDGDSSGTDSVSSSGAGPTAMKPLIDNRGVNGAMGHSHTRRLSLGTTPPVYKVRKLVVSADGKQKPPANR